MDHNALIGRDLHAPSNDVIQNDTGSFLAIGDLVSLNMLKNTEGYRPVDRLATSGEIPVGYVLRAIETGGRDGVLTFGRIEPFITNFGVGRLLKVNAAGNGFDLADANNAVARVVVTGLSGSIEFNGLSGIPEAGTDSGQVFTQSFTISDWIAINPTNPNTQFSITFTHNLNTQTPTFEFVGVNGEVNFLDAAPGATATTTTFVLNANELFAGTVVFTA